MEWDKGRSSIIYLYIDKEVEEGEQGEWNEIKEDQVYNLPLYR